MSPGLENNEMVRRDFVTAQTLSPTCVCVFLARSCGRIEGLDADLRHHVFIADRLASDICMGSAEITVKASYLHIAEIWKSCVLSIV